MRYPLHTTGDLASLPLYLQQKQRGAVWVHVFSDTDRQWARSQCTNAGWRILEGLPIFFVAATRPTVDVTTCDRLRSLIHPSQSPEDAKFLGNLFGYTQEDIAWYIEQSSC